MSMRYKGGVISATADTPGNAGSGPASGVWTLTDQSQAIAASQWPTQVGFNRGVLDGTVCISVFGYLTYIDQSGNAYFLGKNSSTTGTIIKLDVTTNTFSSIVGAATTSGAPRYVGSYNGMMYFSMSANRTMYGFSATSYSNNIQYSWPQTVGAGSWTLDSGAVDGAGNIYTVITQYDCCGVGSASYLCRTTQGVSKSSKWLLQTKVYGVSVSVNSNGVIGLSGGNKTSCVPQMSFTYLSSYDAAAPSWSVYSSSWATNTPSSFVNSDGSVILACLTNVIKMSSAGSIVWQRNFTAGTSCSATALTVDSTGNIYVAFGVIAAGGDTQYYIVKYNSDGAIQWQRYLKRTSPPNGFSTTGITVDYQGAYYLCISQNSTGTPNKELLLKLPTSGSIGGTGLFDSFSYAAGTGTDSAGSISFTASSTSWSNGSPTTYGVSLNSTTSTALTSIAGTVTSNAFS